MKKVVASSGQFSQSTRFNQNNIEQQAEFNKIQNIQPRDQTFIQQYATVFKIFLVLLNIILAGIIIKYYFFDSKSSNFHQKKQCNSIPLQFNPKTSKILKSLPNDATLVQSAYKDVKVATDNNDNLVSEVLRTTGTWENDYLRSFIRLVKKDDVFLNVGSHIGFQAMVLSKKIGPNGKYFFFEPYKKSRDLLIQNIELNGIKNSSTVYPYGASDKQSTGIINIEYDNTGASEISSTTDKSFSQQQKSTSKGHMQKIEIKRVDDVLPKDVKLNFALLDVEKKEYEVMSGMKEVIKRSKDIIIQCQIQEQFFKKNTNYRSDWNELMKWFISEDFKFYLLETSQQLPKFLSYLQPGKCLREVFRPISLQELNEEMFIQEWRILELYMMRSHINPNKLGYE